MGSRYGGLKQLDGLGPNGETIMDYSIYDAIQAGFGKIVWVIRKDFEEQFRTQILAKYEGQVPCELCFQALDALPEGFKVPDTSEFEKLLTPHTKAVLLCNPCNPSGKLFTKDEMMAIGAFCKKHDLFLISDEVYREFCYTDEPYFSAMNIPGCEQNVILVDSVSKRYNLCGARIGVIASHHKDVMAAAMKLAQSRLCPPVLGQYATLGALDTPESYFEEVRSEYIARRDCAIEALNAMPGMFTPCPMGAFYTVAELPIDDAEAFAKWLLTEFRIDNETVMVTPAKSFYRTPGVGTNHVRIAYVLEVPKLKRAMHILAEALKAYPGRTN